MEALADIDSRFVQAGGLQVHYKQAGSGAPDLVLLHGFMNSLVSWQPVLQQPERLGRLHAFDRPAFGLTERRPGWDYSPEAQADLTVALMDAWGIRQAVLVGHSAGGTLALQTALRHPDRVAALVLVDAAVFRGGGAPAFIKPLLASALGRRFGPRLLRRIPERGAREVPAGREQALWEFILASRAPAIAPRLGQIKQPALVISGAGDRIVPAAESRKLAALLPHADYVELQGCGHYPHEERSDAFLAALRSFVERLPGGACHGAK